jgi:hypothetical protein
MMFQNEEWFNITLSKPESMTDEECQEIRAYRDTDKLESGGEAPYFIVKFVPSLEDLEALNNGRGFYLKIFAARFPPVAVFTCDEGGNVN